MAAFQLSVLSPRSRSFRHQQLPCHRRLRSLSLLHSTSVVQGITPGDAEPQGPPDSSTATTQQPSPDEGQGEGEESVVTGFTIYDAVQSLQQVADPLCQDREASIKETEEAIGAIEHVLKEARESAQARERLEKVAEDLKALEKATTEAQAIVNCNKMELTVVKLVAGALTNLREIQDRLVPMVNDIHQTYNFAHDLSQSIRLTMQQHPAYDVSGRGSYPSDKWDEEARVFNETVFNLSDHVAASMATVREWERDIAAVRGTMRETHEALTIAWREVMEIGQALKKIGDLFAVQINDPEDSVIPGMIDMYDAFANSFQDLLGSTRELVEGVEGQVTPARQVLEGGKIDTTVLESFNRPLNVVMGAATSE
ncbi:unnamed protein product [Vitrella brassicaformis CCMP3155]|uniref:Uncharacterized protein n=2 Tax=Vitrella brassicaformis TaxID=1169539 RepID=A0A0G4FLM4_VITBC|nr:unnamed protein product [Vitrella brassicaformis CCMP3155]|eukprot:CEM14677.1 unnamed protein product [Vitrella brassicaformis CCMP3155]